MLAYKIDTLWRGPPCAVCGILAGVIGLIPAQATGSAAIGYNTAPLASWTCGSATHRSFIYGPPASRGWSPDAGFDNRCNMACIAHPNVGSNVATVPAFQERRFGIGPAGTFCQDRQAAHPFRLLADPVTGFFKVISRPATLRPAGDVRPAKPCVLNTCRSGGYQEKKNQCRYERLPEPPNFEITHQFVFQVTYP